MLHFLLYRICAPIIAFFGRCWMRLFGCSITSDARIYGLPRLWFKKGTVTIGKNAFLCSMPFLYQAGQYPKRCSLSCNRNATISIGDDVNMIGSSIHADKSVTIGNRVMMASGCRVVDTNFHMVDRIPREKTCDESPEAVIIEDDVWLGMDVTVLKGVTIGKGSVIGTKSVVTTDIPPMVVAAGYPARVVRSLHLDA